MADPTPAFAIALAESNLRELIGDTAKWLSWTGENTAADAKTHIYEGGFDDDEEPGKRPWILINTSAHDFPAIGGGARNEFVENGELLCILCSSVPTEYQTPGQFRNAKIDFNNDIGELFSEMLQLAFSGGYLNIRNISFKGAQRASRAEENNTDPYIESNFAVTFGLEPG
jgi:hypothetical protein